MERPAYLLADEEEADVVELIHGDVAFLDLVDKIVTQVSDHSCIWFG